MFMEGSHFPPDRLLKLIYPAIPGETGKARSSG